MRLGVVRLPCGRTLFNKAGLNAIPAILDGQFYQEHRVGDRMHVLDKNQRLASNEVQELPSAYPETNGSISSQCKYYLPPPLPD